MPESIFLYADILLPALLAGIIVLSTHIPLGREVLKRGIIFLDLAIAQVAALGLVLVSYLEPEANHQSDQWLLQLIGIAFAICGATLIYQFKSSPARIQEALIGIIFILSATGAILLLTKDPHGGERLKSLLVGQILWVRASDLWGIALTYGLFLLLWFKARENIREYGFYSLFAVVVTLSTQLVGIYLVFASLIIPVLGSMQFNNQLSVAYLIGLLGYLIGLPISAMLDLPSGAMIVWCLAFIAGLFWLFQMKRLQPLKTADKD